jgi:hypothetical protein
MTKPEPFPIGSTVLTPLWRLAIVEGYSRDGKANLRYVGIDASDSVTLHPDLLQLPPDRK